MVSVCGILPALKGDTDTRELSAATSDIYSRQWFQCMTLFPPLRDTERSRLQTQKIRIIIVGGDVAQLVERPTGTPLRQVRFPVRQGIFLPESTFSADSYGLRTPPCAIACINISAHVKEPVVQVRVRWIMNTLKHLECIVGSVAGLCRSWLFQGESNPNFPWEKFQRDNTVVK